MESSKDTLARIVVLIALILGFVNLSNSCYNSVKIRSQLRVNGGIDRALDLVKDGLEQVMLLETNLMARVDSLTKQVADSHKLASDLRVQYLKDRLTEQLMTKRISDMTNEQLLLLTQTSRYEDAFDELKERQAEAMKLKPKRK